jgi:DNA end-binding protein Ku
MAPRTFWRGYLKFSLVTCPVAMAPATSERAKLRFRVLNARTGNEVDSRYVDAETGKPVREEDEAKGYPVAEDRYVILEDEELEAVALESTRTIDVETFVPRDSIGWIWLDTPHYLLPDDEVGEEAFAVIRESMTATGTVGIARLVLYRRERVVMVEPRGKGMVLWTLRYGDEVRRPSDLPEPEAEPDPKLVKLMRSLVKAKVRDWSDRMVQDPVQDRLREIIEAKRAKRKKPPREPKAKPPEATDGKVVSIMDALRKSVAAEKRR